MRITFLADLRSPIAVQWIRFFVERGHDVQAISSYPVSGEVLAGAETALLPLVLAGAGRDGRSSPRAGEPVRRPAMRAYLAEWATPRRVSAARNLFGPAWLRTKRGRLQRLIDRYQPDLVHAMRIPFEGIAAGALTGPPVIVSVWGIDFTLIAGQSRTMARATRRALAKPAVLHCDCERDATLARHWGFPGGRPIWVVPGNGGVDRSIFHPGPSKLRSRLQIPGQSPIILNPRRLREYVRTQTFFTALAPVLRTFPQAHVVCPGMAGSRYAERLVTDAGLDRTRVHLMPTLDHRLMADAFRASRVSVSLSEHDGTPNSLLEAMACGTFPVVGDVASVREWVHDGTNGLVVPAQDAGLVTDALMKALRDESLIEIARKENDQLIRDRADYQQNMRYIESQYEALTRSRPVGPADRKHADFQ